MKQRVATDERPFKASTDDSGQDASSEGEHAAALVVPPDGGWGWVVVGASFLCNFIVDGILLTWGTISPDIKKEFNASEGEVALINSILAGFYLLCGPFVSALANKYGFRKVTIIGSLISSTGFFFSYYATSIVYLYISYGVVGGVGFCMVFMPAVLTVGFYFEKWRALATGLALCGSGVGVFSLSPVMQTLVETYGWRMTVLCQSGLTLLCILFGWLFRPVEPVAVVSVKEPGSDEHERHRAAVDKLNDIMKQSTLESGIRMPHDMKFTNKASPHTWMGVSSNTRYPTAEEVFRGSSTVLNGRRSSATPGTIKTTHTTKPTYEPVTERDEHEDAGNNADKPSAPLISQTGATLKVVPHIHDSRNRSSMADLVTRPLYREDAFFAGSLARLPQYTSRTSMQYHLAVTHVPTDEDAQEKGKWRCCPVAVRRALATLLDVSLFKSVTFLILALSGFFTMLGFFVPFVYVQHRAEANNMPEEAYDWLVSAIGVANIVGRIVSGTMSSFPRVSPLWCINIALTVGGIASIFSSYSYDNYFQFTYCCVFGFSVGCFASLRSVVCVDYLGLERLTNCFGLFLLFQGVGALLGAPIAGSLYDYTQSYDVSFYVSGSFLLLSALICYPIDRISKWEKKRNAEKIGVTQPKV